jgi:hypothetical protein
MTSAFQFPVKKILREEIASMVFLLVAHNTSRPIRTDVTRLNGSGVAPTTQIRSNTDVVTSGPTNNQVPAYIGLGF